MRGLAIILALAGVPTLSMATPNASDDLYEGFLPASDELFQPLLADPRELHYALRFGSPVGQKSIGEAAMGDYLGLYRWRFSGTRRFIQLNVGGGVFGRFDIARKSNEMQAVDFYGKIPVDVAIGSWSLRSMLFHTSSHLGDDYLKRTGQSVQKSSQDSLRWILSNQIKKQIRLYGGHTYSLQTFPRDLGRNAVQIGGEWTFSIPRSLHQIYSATDYQAWERSSWKPSLNSQIGLTLHNKANKRLGLSFFGELFSGQISYGQFSAQRETRWTAGLRFGLS